MCGYGYGYVCSTCVGMYVVRVLICMMYVFSDGFATCVACMWYVCVYVCGYVCCTCVGMYVVGVWVWIWVCM